MKTKPSSLSRIIRIEKSKSPNLFDQDDFERRFFERLVELHKEQSIRQLAVLVSEKTGVKCSRELIRRWLKRTLVV